MLISVKRDFLMGEKEIFFDIKGNDRDIQLRNVLVDLIKEGLIMPVHGIRQAWVIVE